MVNSGPADFYTPKAPLQERALQEQPRRHVHRRHRQGGRRRRHGVRHGLRRRATTTTTAIPTSSSPPTAAARCTTTTATARSPTSPRRPGVAAPGWTTSAVWFDYDNDGKLDLVPLQLRPVLAEQATSFCGDNKLGKRFYCIPRVFKPTPSLLYHNNGDGTFTEVSAGTDIHARARQGARRRRHRRQRRRPDGPVRRQRHGAELPVHEPRQGQVGRDRRWPRKSASAPTARRAPGMGVDAADFDGDGRQDLFVANVDQEMFSLYQNDGNESFADVAAANGVAQATRLLSGWGLKFFDYDNDGAGRSVPRQRPSRRHDRELLAAGALQGAAAAVPSRRHASS